MRRIYLLVLAVVLVATLVGLAISEQAGYVLIAYKSFRYESSLWSFLALRQDIAQEAPKTIRKLRESTMDGGVARMSG